VWSATLAALRAEHRRQRFDVLHAFWATESGLLAAIAGRLLHVPTLVSLAGGELVSLPEVSYGDQRVAGERLKVRSSLHLASGVSAGSQLLIALAKRHVPSARLWRAPLGVDLERFWPAHPRVHHRAHFLNVATLTPVKDQVTLLRAFARAREALPDARLTFVGDGPLRRELETFATNHLQLGDGVRWCGAIDHAALPRVYQSASALVVSSRHEAQGMVALEAAACGVPVVGTRVGVVPELTCHIAAARDAAALAAAMVASANDRDARAAAALQRVRADFGLERCADRFRAIYLRLIAQNAAAHD
jgi:glycosyltransferase involved in cell wall biosynthesis